VEIIIDELPQAASACWGVQWPAITLAASSGQGAEPVAEKPEQFAQFIAAETAKWAKVVKASGASLD